MARLTPNCDPGKLIAVEGIDGCGKSTQISRLARWLRSQGVTVESVEANTSNFLGEAVRRGKDGRLFTSTSLSLLQAAEFANRLENQIVPALRAGAVVCADRYAFTAFARDVARGADREWIRTVYGFAIQPDLCFWFHIPVEEALERILDSRPGLAYYEAGMDLNLSRDSRASFRAFQQVVAEQYEEMAEELGFHIIDGMRPVHEQQSEIRRVVAEKLGLTPAEES